MSNTGWHESRVRSTGVNNKIKTGAQTDYDIISKYNQFDTALVVQVFRHERDINGSMQTKNVDAEIGAILCKPQNRATPGNIKAYPLSTNIIQYPAEGEYVKIGTFGGDSEQVFYELISTSGNVNYNGNPGKLLLESNRVASGLEDGEQLINKSTTFKAGSQFKLRPFTSDLILQSRFGANIRMTDMESDPTKKASTLILSNNIAPSPNTKIEENLNDKGSYIILTSGDNHTEFIPSVYRDFVNSNATRISPSAFEAKTTFRNNHIVNRADGNWIQDNFTTGSYSFKGEFFGDRIIVSSDEVIQQSSAGDSYYLSSGNLIMYSKHATSIDAMRGMDINTNKASFRLKANNTYISSPNIFLGAEEDRSQPAILGENLLILLELLISSLKQYIDLNEIFFDATYTAPGQAESADNFRNLLKELVTNGRISEDIRRNLLSDKVFIASNRIDPQVDSPVTN